MENNNIVKGRVKMIFYNMNNGEKKETDILSLNDNELTLGFMTDEELKSNYEAVGIPHMVAFDVLNTEKNRNTLYTYEHFSYGILGIINPRDIFGERDKTAYFIRKNLLLIIDIQDSSSKEIEGIFNLLSDKLCVQDLTLEKMIYGFFSFLVKSHKDYIEDLSDRENVLEEMLINDKTKQNFSKTVFSTKKELLAFDTYYDQLIYIGEELIENENDLFSDDGIKYFKIFTNKVVRLHDRVNNITSYLVHLSDAYQASLDHSINKTMKIFTVVTTIFLPLTLITGWYGMNFVHMPELHWQWGYYGLMGICIMIVAGCLILFKKKKWM